MGQKARDIIAFAIYIIGYIIINNSVLRRRVIELRGSIISRKRTFGNPRTETAVDQIRFTTGYVETVPGGSECSKDTYSHSHYTD